MTTFSQGGFPIDRGARTDARVRRVFQTLDASSGGALGAGQGLLLDGADQTLHVNAGQGLSISSAVNDRALDVNVGPGLVIDGDRLRVDLRAATIVGGGDTQKVVGSGLIAGPGTLRVLLDESRGLSWNDYFDVQTSVNCPNAQFGVKVAPFGGVSVSSNGQLRASTGGGTSPLIPQWETVRIDLRTQVAQVGGTANSLSIILIYNRPLWFVHAVRIAVIEQVESSNDANEVIELSIGPGADGPTPFSDSSVGYYDQVRDYRGFAMRIPLDGITFQREWLCEVPRRWLRGAGTSNAISTPLGDAALPASGSEGAEGIPWGNGGAGGFNLDQTYKHVVAHFKTLDRLNRATGVIDVSVLISNPGAA